MGVTALKMDSALDSILKFYGEGRRDESQKKEKIIGLIFFTDIVEVMMKKS